MIPMEGDRKCAMEGMVERGTREGARDAAINKGSEEANVPVDTCITLPLTRS